MLTQHGIFKHPLNGSEQSQKWAKNKRGMGLRTRKFFIQKR